MSTRLLFTLLLLVVAIVPAAASEVYALQGSAIGPAPDSCTFYEWNGNVLFHNTGNADVVIRVSNVSTGQSPAGEPVQIAIGPHRTSSLNTNWPFIRPALWVAKLDIPDTIIVESRIEIGTQFCAGPPPIGNPNRGKLSFPVFRSLQPAGVAKIHLGTDLVKTNARNNVAIYNAADATANAHVEVRRGCDDSLIDARDVQIPGRTVISVNGLGAPTGVDPCGSTAPWVTYVAVAVDQPSLSWVSTLANGKDLSVVYGATSSSP